MKTIYIVNASGENCDAASEVAANAESLLRDSGKDLRVRTSQEDATLTRFEKAWSVRRRSLHLGHELLYRYIEHVRKAEDFATILVTDAEIMVGFPPRMTDGVAFPYFGFSAVSLSNIRNHDRLLFYDRWEKLLLHEIGHLSGLRDHLPKAKH